MVNVLRLRSIHHRHVLILKKEYTGVFQPFNGHPSQDIVQ